MSQPTHITLLQRVRNQQDEKSWQEFTTFYRGYIYAVLHRLGMNHHDAEDLSQEVLLKAWKALPDYECRQVQGQFRNWLSHVCINTLRSSHRRMNTQGRKQPEFLDLEHSSEPEIEALAEKEWRVYISDLAWKQIKERFSESVQQSFLLSAEGLNSTEVARRLGLAESSVRVNKQRVTAALCKEIVRLDIELNGEPG
jgi:RNA polymerase sigma factor (sigma-70 family)